MDEIKDYVKHMIWENENYQKDLEQYYKYIEPQLLNIDSILITGCTGLIGSYLIDLLVYYNRKSVHKINIKAVARNKEKVARRFKYIEESDNVSFIYGSITCPIDIEENVQWIVHLASNADPISYARYPVETILTNIEGTKNVLDLAKEKGAKVLLASTMEVYGAVQKESIEETDIGYLDFNNMRAGYPESKRVAEVLCRSYMEQYGIEFDVARLGYIYGPTMMSSDSKAVAQFLRKAAMKQDIELKSAGKQYRSYCYVGDVVSALLFIMSANKHGEVYNVANKYSNTTILDLAKEISKQANVDIKYVEATEIEGKGVSKTNNSILNEDKLRELGWQSKKGLKEGIKTTLDILLSLEEMQS